MNRNELQLAAIKAGTEISGKMAVASKNGEPFTLLPDENVVMTNYIAIILAELAMLSMRTALQAGDIAGFASIAVRVGLTDAPLNTDEEASGIIDSLEGSLNRL